MVACTDGPIPLAGAPDDVVDAVLRLNLGHVTELSALNDGSLDRLIRESFHASVINQGAAFLIALDQDSDYDSPNFRWFQSRYDRFVYVDRIAVAASARGQGLANLLYSNLFEFASSRGQSIIACEVNLDPPNPASDAFHRSHGFEEVGRAELASGKMVRYLIKRLNRASELFQPTRTGPPLPEQGELNLS